MSFNSQASYEARRAAYASLSAVLAVSIHRPHTRPDFSLQWSARAGIVFQFTGLIRGPTRFGGKQMTLILFQFTGLIRGPTDSIADIIYPGWFQFTGLIRGPTKSYWVDCTPVAVSIHRPHTRPDPKCSTVPLYRSLFQFTGLIRGPTHLQLFAIRKFEVSIHRPHTRPDFNFLFVSINRRVSIHRPHTRPDR